MAKPLSRAELRALRALASLHADSDPHAVETLRLLATIDMLTVSLRALALSQDSDARGESAPSERASNSPNAGEVRETSSGQGSGSGGADSVTGRRDGQAPLERAARRVDVAARDLEDACERTASNPFVEAVRTLANSLHDFLRAVVGRSPEDDLTHGKAVR